MWKSVIFDEVSVFSAFVWTTTYVLPRCDIGHQTRGITRLHFLFWPHLGQFLVSVVFLCRGSPPKSRLTLQVSWHHRMEGGSAWAACAAPHGAATGRTCAGPAGCGAWVTSQCSSWRARLVEGGLNGVERQVGRTR